ncbi:thiolase C-terminal domain-containing protein [Aeromicrobium sp.]|uniref:thiolase C-terminal domain-containing protein n=1 Tax=Aeromicrobium sp. TaxID=1871063 RepID=UPI0028A9F8A1|nr:lipid-transfer protein [Aeromicrobium sp.]
MTELTKKSGRSVMSLALEACRGSVDDAGMNLSEVDGVISYGFNNDSVSSQAVATALGLPAPRYLVTTEMGGQAPCFLIMQAAAAIEAGLADNVLVYRALNGRSGQRVGTAKVPGTGPMMRYPAGLVAYPQIIAMWARRYLIETGRDESDLAAVVSAQRLWAVDNERAMRRTLMSEQDYARSPMVADPFRAADCTTEADGACAILVTSRRRALDLRHDPVVIEGAAYGTGKRSGLDAGDAMLWPDLTRNYTTHIAEQLWSSAGMGPRDVDMAQLYDCFSSSVLLALEGLGLAERGEAGRLVSSGATVPGGRLPVNTGGGLLAEGYLHGMNTVYEAVSQLQGSAGKRTVPDARSCVVTSGALTDGSALVLTRETRN